MIWGMPPIKKTLANIDITRIYYYMMYYPEELQGIVPITESCAYITFQDKPFYRLPNYSLFIW
jgi:hypothetical protein